MYCEDCAFYDGDYGSPQQGICRRHPPVWNEDDGGVWPRVEERDYCGEWVHHFLYHEKAVREEEEGKRREDEEG